MNKTLLLALLYAFWPSNAVVSQNDAAITQESKKLGLVSVKPDKGPFVETDRRFMVPYKMKITGSDISFEMIPIPGGKFQMGSPSTEKDRRNDEGPQFKVTIEPFWIGKHEVTWAEYKLYMKLDKVFKAFESKGVRKVADVQGNDTITAPSSLYDPSFTFEAGEAPNEPAATMSQFAAKQYTKWLSLISNDFFRLPTESEWEYACRAGTNTRFYFGDDESELADHAWYYENSDELRHPVGQLKPNPWGLHDMYGNVAEWVLDQYIENHYQSLQGKSLTAMDAWAKPKKVFPRVLRGGSWELEAEDCRSAARMASNEEWKDEDPNYPQSPWWYTTSPGLGTGFRIIRPLEVPSDRKSKELFWTADVPRIFKDAKNRIKDNGRGAFGTVNPKLIDAIKNLTDEDR